MQIYSLTAHNENIRLRHKYFNIIMNEACYISPIYCKTKPKCITDNYYTACNNTIVWNVKLNKTLSNSCSLYTLTIAFFNQAHLKILESFLLPLKSLSLTDINEWCMIIYFTQSKLAKKVKYLIFLRSAAKLYDMLLYYLSVN